MEYTRDTLGRGVTGEVTMSAVTYAVLVRKLDRFENAIKVAPGYGDKVDVTIDLRPWASEMDSACADLEAMMPGKHVELLHAKLLASKDADIFRGGDCFKVTDIPDFEEGPVEASDHE